MAILIGLVSVVAGCGGRSTAVEQSPVPLPADPLGEQAVREVVQIRAAGAGAGAVSRQIFSIIAAAGRQPRAEGSGTLRRELGPLLRAASTVWPRSYRAVAAQAPNSEVGRRQRAILLRAVHSEQASLARLRVELQVGPDAWQPVLRFGVRSELLRRALARQVETMMRTIPVHERRALQEAIASRG